MRLSEEVAAILTLGAKGWGSRRISKELGISRRTAYAQPRRSWKLDGLESFVGIEAMPR